MHFQSYSEISLSLNGGGQHNTALCPPPQFTTLVASVNPLRGGNLEINEGPEDSPNSEMWSFAGFTSQIYCMPNYLYIPNECGEEQWFKQQLLLRRRHAYPPLQTCFPAAKQDNSKQDIEKRHRIYKENSFYGVSRCLRGWNRVASIHLGVNMFQEHGKNFSIASFTLRNAKKKSRVNYRLRNVKV
jgi:hypothetical protein